MDFPPNHKDKGGYVLEFSDEFDGTELDTSKWFPYLLPHWSSLGRSKARFTLRDGSLKLLVEKEQMPWGDGSDRASNFQTANFSGVKGSRVGQFRHYNPNFVVTEDLPVVRNYTPQFGYFETRLKAVPVVGYHVALWMIGFDEAHSGEIRVFELHGGNVGTETSRVDYGVLPWDDPKLREETYEDDVPMNAADYHIYGVEWTPTKVDFYVDNVKLRTLHQSPRYPMQCMRGLYERPRELCPEDSEIPFPRVCEVDYFRAYQPVDGY
ncbi:MAG: glycoside hydrolase family 16 protein [Trueperaceae bacterium]